MGLGILMKVGILKQNTKIYTPTITYIIPKGTTVVANGKTLSFRQFPFIKCHHDGNGKYYLNINGNVAPIIFPNGGVPYPFSMLK